ncbi:hypothetical protein [Yersinia enterocolitica]
MAFLKRNGIEIRDEGNELEELTVSAATGVMDSAEIAVVLCQLSVNAH